MRITGIAIEPLGLPLDPPLHAAWDPVPRTSFEATLVRVRTDEGWRGRQRDRLDGFAPYAGLLSGRTRCASPATRGRWRGSSSTPAGHGR